MEDAGSPNEEQAEPPGTSHAGARAASHAGAPAPAPTTSPAPRSRPAAGRVRAPGQSAPADPIGAPGGARGDGAADRVSNGRSSKRWMSRARRAKWAAAASSRPVRFRAPDFTKPRWRAATARTCGIEASAAMPVRPSAITLPTARRGHHCRRDRVEHGAGVAREELPGAAVAGGTGRQVVQYGFGDGELGGPQGANQGFQRAPLLGGGSGPDRVEPVRPPGVGVAQPPQHRRGGRDLAVRG